MKELELLLDGIAAGLIIAVPVGPVNVWCMSRTLSSGWKSGVVSGLGAALADMLYGAVAGFSISVIIQFLQREIFWIRFYGAILMLVLGVRYFFKEPSALRDQSQGGSNTLADLRSTFLLTLTNPTTVLSFLAVLATLGLGEHRAWGLTVLLVGGIFAGSMLWWIVLASLVNHFRHRFDDRKLRWLNRIAGIAIGGFGIATFLLNYKRS